MLTISLQTPGSPSSLDFRRQPQRNLTLPEKYCDTWRSTSQNTASIGDSAYSQERRQKIVAQGRSIKKIGPKLFVGARIYFFSTLPFMCGLGGFQGIGFRSFIGYMYRRERYSDGCSNGRTSWRTRSQAGRYFAPHQC